MDILNKHNLPYCKMIKVVCTECVHCRKQFEKGSFICALGEPYHCLLHTTCLPFFNYNSGYPHPLPTAAYTETPYFLKPGT